MSPFFTVFFTEERPLDGIKVIASNIAGSFFQSLQNFEISTSSYLGEPFCEIEDQADDNFEI